MLYALDLTQRQAKRVLEQALRTKAPLSIEPRNSPDDRPICGRLKSIDGNLLYLDLSDDAGETNMTGLIGTFCDVQTILSEQIYLFASCVLDVYDTTAPRSLVLALPDSIQVGNRRRFVRRTLARSSTVEVTTDEAGEPCQADLCNLGGNGLACRISKEMDSFLLIGEQVRIRFDVPGLPDIIDVAAIVCNKTPTGDHNAMLVGLQFDLSEGDPAEAQAIERLRIFLCDATTTHEEGLA